MILENEKLKLNDNIETVCDCNYTLYRIFKNISNL